jgi:hypothetical protein
MYSEISHKIETLSAKIFNFLANFPEAAPIDWVRGRCVFEELTDSGITDLDAPLPEIRSQSHPSRIWRDRVNMGRQWRTKQIVDLLSRIADAAAQEIDAYSKTLESQRGFIPEFGLDLETFLKNGDLIRNQKNKLLPQKTDTPQDF